MGFENEFDIYIDEDDDIDLPESLRTKKRKTKFSAEKLIGAFIGGGVGLVVSEIVYHVFEESIARPLLIGLYFVIIALFEFLFVFSISWRFGDHFEIVGIDRRKRRRHVLMTLGGLCAVFVGAAVLELLYELDPSGKNITPSSYIIVEDISESMQSNDSTRQLPEATRRLVKNMDEGFPFAVYPFSSDVGEITPMHKRNNADLANDWNFDYSGSTELTGVLRRILNDYSDAVDKGTWTGGTVPKVLVITDGCPTDAGLFNINLNSVVKEYRRNGIAISSVCVKNADVSLMTQIAEKTGGVCISADDVDQLYEQMEQGFIGKAARDLISPRTLIKYDGLFSFLRILFITIIGTAFALLHNNANCMEDELLPILVTDGVSALLSGFLFEFLYRLISSGNLPVHIAGMLLIVFFIPKTIVRKKQSAGESNKDDWGDPDDFSNTDNYSKLGGSHESGGFSELI